MPLLHQRATARSLGALRLFIFGLWFIRILFDPFPELAEFPTDLFRPPGALKILPHAAWGWLFTPAGLWTIKMALLAALAGAAAGWRFRLNGAMAVLLLVLQQGLSRGFTYVYHEGIPLLYAAALLVLFPCDDALRLRPPSAVVRDGRVYTAAWLSVAAMLTLCFCSIGVQRCVAGGLDLFASDSLRLWILRNATVSPNPWAFVGPAAVAYPGIYFLLKAGFVLTTVFEVTAPMALISSFYRKLFVPAMLLFFVLNALLMNVVFWETALLLIVLIDWSESARPPDDPAGSTGSGLGPTRPAS